MSSRDKHRVTSAALLQLAACVVIAQSAGGLRSPSVGYGGASDRCEKITIPMCADMKYNMTHMPNLIGHTSQKEALQVHEFVPLVQFGCSRLLKFFLCSVYVPMCTEQVDEILIIPACRSMCLEVRKDCEPVLKKFNFPWPPVLDCANLPEHSDRQTLCMEAPTGGNADEIFGSQDVAGLGDLGDVKLPTNLPGLQQPNWVKLVEELKRGGNGLDNGGGGTGAGSVGGKNAINVWQQGGGSSPVATTTKLVCGERFILIERLQERGLDSACAPRCNVEILFRKEDKRFAFIWTTVWAGCSLAAAILTVLTFFVDTSRFPYPERPIIFLAMCFIPLAVAYLMRAGLPAEMISCDRVPTETGADGDPFIVQDGLDNTWCVVIFVLVYYFQMASALWWLTLSVTWFLAAARKWGAEAIQRFGNYFHLVAWTVPAAQTIVVLVMRRVDGDELLGLCYVGSRDAASRLALVIAPLLVYLVLGSIFILAGFLAMLRIRADLRRHEQAPGGGNIRKLEKLMAKIGLFAVLYALPVACVIGTHFYEHVNQSRWLQQARHIACQTTAAKNGDGANSAGEEVAVELSADGKSLVAEGWRQCAPYERSLPSVEVFMLRHFMMLVVGITSGMWVWSAKTVRTWRRFCSSASRRKASASMSAGACVPPGPSGYTLQGMRSTSLKVTDPTCSYLKGAPGGPAVHLPLLDKSNKHTSRI